MALGLTTRQAGTNKHTTITSLVGAPWAQLQGRLTGWLTSFGVVSLQKGAAQLGALKDMLVSLSEFKGKMGGKGGSAGIVEAMISEVRKKEKLVRSQPFPGGGALDRRRVAVAVVCEREGCRISSYPDLRAPC